MMTQCLFMLDSTVLGSGEEDLPYMGKSGYLFNEWEMFEQLPVFKLLDVSGDIRL